MARLVRTEIHGVNSLGDITIFGVSWEGPQSGVDPQTEANALALAFGNAASTNLMGSYTDGQVFDRFYTRVFESTTGAVLPGGEVGLTLVGTGTGSNLPVDVAYAVSLRTLTSGPRGRGRFYLPAPRVGTVTTEGRATETFMEDVQDTIGAWINAMDVEGYTPVVYSRTHKSFAAVTEVQFGDVFDTQRRRDNAIREKRAKLVL